MSKCLRCGAGNEWIEPVAKEAKKPRRKRPKVRYIVYHWSGTEWGVHLKGKTDFVATCPRKIDADSIAAALNIAEAVRRGEL